MQAVVCKELGGPEKLVIEERDAPKCGPRDARIAVKACGVNFPDTLIIQGLYQLKPPLPFTPGNEIAGIVTEVGENVTNVNVGDPVLAWVMYGGFVSEICLPAAQLIPLPEDMPLTEAACLPVVYGTVLHALQDRGQLKSGETLLVLGATGGVGSAAVQLGKIIGAKVIAAGGSDEKLEKIRAEGADEVINYNDEDLKDRIKALTKGQGADVVFDAVGGDHFDAAIRRVAWNGRYLVVGFAAGRIPECPINLLLLKGASLVGVFWGQFAVRQMADNLANFKQLFSWYAEGKFRPQIQQAYPLAEAADALQALLDRKVVGKVVLTND